MDTFRRQHKNDFFTVIFDDGERVIVADQDGTIAFNGTKALFDACWDRGIFTKY